LQAKVWGSVGEQQTLKPAVEQLKKQLAALGTQDSYKKSKFTADSGFHSEVNLQFIATTGLDAYIADNAFRSRNPLFKNSETYLAEKENRRLKQSQSRIKKFVPSDFYFDKASSSCQCPAGNSMILIGTNIKGNGKFYTRFTGYLDDCKNCPIQRQCMRKAPKKVGRQVQFLNEITEEQANYTDKMRSKIDSSKGRRQYSKRLGTVEPVFGNITVNKRMDRFTLRGQEKVNAQWQMYCLVHNIEKLRNVLH